MDNMGMDESEGGGDMMDNESSSENEMPSVFLSKEQLGGKTVKKGDTIQMKVLDVDPESGDAEVECQYGKDMMGETKPGYESDFDQSYARIWRGNVIMAITDCQDRDQLEAEIPCLNCLSMHELLTLMLVILANTNGTDGDVPALEAGAAKFRNIGDLEFARGLISSLPGAMTDGLDPTDLGGDYPCLKCYGDQELKAMILNQWCVYWGT